MMIVGMTGCGKTYYLLDMPEKEYFCHFDYIFLICPMYFWNKTYQEWIYKDSEKFYPLPCDLSLNLDLPKISSKFLRTISKCKPIPAIISAFVYSNRRYFRVFTIILFLAQSNSATVSEGIRCHRYTSCDWLDTLHGIKIPH